MTMETAAIRLLAHETRREPVPVACQRRHASVFGRGLDVGASSFINAAREGANPLATLRNKRQLSASACTLTLRLGVTRGNLEFWG